MQRQRDREGGTEREREREIDSPNFRSCTAEPLWANPIKGRTNPVDCGCAFARGGQLDRCFVLSRERERERQRERDR